MPMNVKFRMEVIRKWAKEMMTAKRKRRNSRTGWWPSWPLFWKRVWKPPWIRHWMICWRTGNKAGTRDSIYRYPRPFSLSFVRLVFFEKPFGDDGRCSKILLGRSGTRGSSPWFFLPLVLFEATPNRNQSRSTALPIISPPAVQEKAYQISLTKLGRFTAILPPVGIASWLSAKAFVLLNAPLRLFHILQEVGGLTVQEATDFVDVL